MSFVKTYLPDLLNEGDVETRVNTTLSKEFGKDFVPVSEDENKRGTKTYRYYKKYDTLYSKYENEQGSGGEGIKTLKELSDKRENEQTTRRKAYADKISKFKKDKNLSDSDITGLHNFMGKLEIEHFWDILQFQLQYGNTGVKPNINQIPGGQPNLNQNPMSNMTNFQEVDNYVNDILGPAPQK